MTVSTTTSAILFDGNDVATSFPFAFAVYEDVHIIVTHVDSANAQTILTQGTDYTLARNADQSANPGGTVTYPVSGAPLATGERLLVTRWLDFLQEVDLINTGAVAPETVEGGMDRIVMMIQQINEVQGRIVQLPATAVDFDGEVGEPTAFYYLQVNSDNTGFEWVPGTNQECAADQISFDDTNVDITATNVQTAVELLVGGWELVSSQTLDDTTDTYDFTGLGGYSRLLLVGEDLQGTYTGDPSNVYPCEVLIRFQTSGGWETGLVYENSNYTNIRLVQQSGTPPAQGASDYLDFTLELWNFGTSQTRTLYQAGAVEHFTNNPLINLMNRFFSLDATNKGCTGIRVYTAGSRGDRYRAGKMTLYGVAS